MSAVSSESPPADADLSAPSANPSTAGDFGANEWLVDELYQRYLTDPDSVDRAWWSFFADYRPSRPGIAAATPAAQEQDGALADGFWSPAVEPSPPSDGAPPARPGAAPATPAAPAAPASANGAGRPAIVPPAGA